METSRGGRRRLKQRLTRLFRSSSLLRSTCSSSSSAATSSRSLSSSDRAQPCHVCRLQTPQDKKEELARKKKTEEKKKLLSNAYGFTTSSSSDDCSDDGERKYYLWSSRSFSSGASSEFYKRPLRNKQAAKKKKKKKKKRSDGYEAMITRSRDPYGDFRRSMVEMIVERQVFGEEQLEGLLEKYLSLNSPDHHRVIIMAFSDIWEVLFSY